MAMDDDPADGPCGVDGWWVAWVGRVGSGAVAMDGDPADGPCGVDGWWVTWVRVGSFGCDGDA